MPAYTTDSAESGGRHQVILAAVFVVLAAVAIFLPAPQQQWVATGLRSTVLRPFLITQEGLAEARVRATESRQLRSQLDSLVAVLSTRTHLAEENVRLRGLLSLAQRVGPAFVPAGVIRPGTVGSESMFLLDVGSGDGVGANAPVLTRNGLVGVVREVQGGTAIGMDWTHPDFRAGAMTVDGVVYGMAESRRGDFREEDRLLLNGVPFHAELEEGTLVVTSGLGGVFPRGIPVGRVEGLAEADAGWRKSYWLQPMVQPGSVTQALVGADPGQEGTIPTDLSAAWPADSILTEAELAARWQARQDSLDALGDSLAALSVQLQAYRTADSAALAATTPAAVSRADSLARAARAATPAPARPSASGATGAAAPGAGGSGSAGVPSSGAAAPSAGGGTPSGGTATPSGGAAARETPPPTAGSGEAGAPAAGESRPPVSVQVPRIRPAVPTPEAVEPRVLPLPVDTIRLPAVRDPAAAGPDSVRRDTLHRPLGSLSGDARSGSPAGGDARSAPRRLVAGTHPATEAAGRGGPLPERPAGSGQEGATLG